MATSRAIPIWTLDARDNVFLEVVQGYFDLSDNQVRRLIVSSHEEVVRILDRKGLPYQKLRWALSPRAGRGEQAFFFDTAKIESGWYGFDVVEKILAAIRRDSTCSFLVGDMIAKDQDLAFQILERHMQLHKSIEIGHTSQLYCVYINNLSSSAPSAIHDALTDYEPYIGFADVTFGSPMKDWLSTTLVNRYVKIRNTLLTLHEDDVSNEEDVNLPGWPLEELGYRYRSVQATYFQLLLSYKIERAVYPGFESDTRFALAAISDTPLDLSDCSVLIEEAKAGHLRGDKGGSLRRAGLAEASIGELEGLIRARVSSNYIYNLRFEPEHDVSLFNVLLELRHPGDGTPVKLTAALEYQPEGRVLKVVTFF